MADVQVENFVLNTSADASSAIWKLTRGLKTAGWRYKASADGTSKDATGDPNADLWGPGIQVGAQTGGGGFTIGAPTTTAYGGRSVITNLPGATFTTASVGHFLKITGATNPGNNGTFLITNYNSATSVTIENPNAVSETVGVGGPSWTELSALSDTFPTLLSGSWWCAQGPSTMKIPIGSSVPTGTFIRGENVTQSASGATGELMGVVTDTHTGQGYLVISPRLSGTGSGPRGWSSLVTSTITGSRSGATITPAGTVIEFVREVVFWKDSTSNGHIYFQVIDQANEAAISIIGTGRFSLMAAAAASTATICPGGAATNSPTTNGFPAYGSYVPLGAGGSGLATTGSRGWANSSASLGTGKAQILVTNCIEDSNVSADGTITFAIGDQPTSTTAYSGWGFHRCDDGEDGDVDPYVWWMYDNRISNSRTRILGNQTQAGADMFTHGLIWNGTPFMGWRRRGYGTLGAGPGANGDYWVEMNGYILGNSGGIFANQNTGNPERLACTFVTTTLREPIYVAGVSIVNNVPVKIRKGTLRWWYMVQGNAGNDTYDGQRWIQLSSTAFPIVVGPADGATTPVNQ